MNRIKERFGWVPRIPRTHALPSSVASTLSKFNSYFNIFTGNNKELITRRQFSHVAFGSLFVKAAPAKGSSQAQQHAPCVAAVTPLVHVFTSFFLSKLCLTKYELARNKMYKYEFLAKPQSWGAAPRFDVFPP